MKKRKGENENSNLALSLMVLSRPYNELISMWIASAWSFQTFVLRRVVGSVWFVKWIPGTDGTETDSRILHSPCRHPEDTIFNYLLRYSLEYTRKRKNLLGSTVLGKDEKVRFKTRIISHAPKFRGST
jgi:hypothetical protein